MQHELARQQFGLSELASVLSDLVTWAKIPQPVANPAEWAKGYREKLRSAAQLPDMQQQLVKDAITAGLALIARWEHSTNLQRIPADQWGLAADRRLVEDVAAAARKVRMQAACLMNRSEALQLIRQWQDPGKWSALAKTEKDIAQYQKWADILGGDVRLNLEQGNLQAAEECRKAADMNRGAVWTLRQQVFDLREEYLRIENWVRANVPQLLGELPVTLDVSQTPDLEADKQPL